jgi:hypothetical protein
LRKVTSVHASCQAWSSNPAARRVVDGGQQHPMFSGEPGQSRAFVAQVLRRDTGRALRERERVARRIQQPVGGIARTQVVLQHPDLGGAALLGGIELVGEVVGIDPQQVVERVPAGGVLHEQAGVGEFSSSGRTRAGGRAARPAAADTDRSGPGCRPSSRNSRAASVVRAR